MLSCFIGSLEKFNKSQPIDEGFKKRLRTFFYYRWVHDKTICLQNEEYNAIYMELPLDVRIRLLTSNLHNNFINKFYKFFRIKKPNHFVYTWAD